MNALTCYLRTHRRRSGLLEEELAALLGLKRGSAISRHENEERYPELVAALAYQVIFDVSPAEMFPGLYGHVEEETIRRIYELYEQLQGNASQATRAKLELLEAAMARAKRRLENISV